MRARARFLAIVIAFSTVAGGAGAAADTTATPWSAGITDAQKAAAQRELDAGNTLFLDKKYADALRRYQAAIAVWDHPAIRFNVVRCLIQLDRPVEAMDNLKLALAYGAAPLEEAVYTEALAYEKLLARQIGELAIICAQDAVRLTLDGQPLGTCPMRENRRVAPGAHQIVGVKQGFLTRTVEVVVVGGTQETVSIELAPFARAGRVVHRWPTWVPWVVFGSGFAVIGAGALLDLNAAADMASYDRSVKQQCPMLACDPSELPPEVRALEADARRNSRIAVGIMTVGAATVLGGGVMLYLNRGRTVYDDESVMPVVGVVPGGATLDLRGSF
ncbi:MAG: hypothetical protein H0T89_31150 [Deltaproteobacteria bacterium]|nr:hypothetical protein [Deltaproteobacteria bacterium]MDQ3300655.1 hypothetical protein [Myxococcota bacterium]